MSEQPLDNTTSMGNEDLRWMLQTLVPKTTIVSSPDAKGEADDGTMTGVEGQRYEVGNVLGAGGMGVVMQAFDKNLERSVAMKVLQRSRVTDGAHALRFIREAEITGGLEHPNIIPLHELGLDNGGNAYYTMKQVRGETLKHVLKKLRDKDPEYTVKYPFQRLMEIFQKICDAVGLAHERGVIHRDLKPENVMIGDYGEVLVIDWGLARKVDADNPTEPEPAAASNVDAGSENPLEFVTKAGAVMGTPGYMAPEQALGAGVGPLSDVYSLGAILYSILTFRRPVNGRNMNELMVNLLNGDVPTPQELWEGNDTSLPHHLPDGMVPSGISAVAMKALSRNQAKRYASVGDLRRDVVNFLSGYATDAENASLLRKLMLLFNRSRKVVAVVLVTVIALLLVAVTFTRRLQAETQIAVDRETEANRELAEADATRAAAREVFESLKSKTGTLARQARHRLEAHDTLVALELIDQAIFLDPQVGEYHVLKGDILQNRFKFREADAAYAEAQRLMGVVPGLLERREASSAFAKIPDRSFIDMLGALNEHFVALGRYEESLNVLHQIGRKMRPYLATGKALVKTKNWDGELSIAKDILYGNSGRGSGEMRAIKLEVAKCGPYFDFRDVRGMGIKDLRINGALFLTGLDALVLQHDLHRLAINGVKRLDLAHLNGLKVKELILENCEVHSPECLNDLGVLSLKLSGKNFDDQSIKKFHGRHLRKLVIDHAPITNLDFLDRFPAIDELELSRVDVTAVPPAHVALSELACFGVPIKSLDGLNLSIMRSLRIPSSKVNDLECVRGKSMPNLTSLDLNDCPIADLSPLQGHSRFLFLFLKGTRVRDLTPLRATSISTLDIRQTAVTDLTPIRDNAFDEIYLTVENMSETSIKTLRNMRVKKINFSNAGQFWMQYDNEKSEKKVP